ncbi:MAG TPA: APC family permease [Candidatus Dormibacteraeota bacterium]|nr:APC family permease [Candidatus Dormibacteraeota bacterium]
MQLRRTLGLFDVVLFFVVAGSNLQWVATAAAAGPSSIPVWIIGGLAMFAPLSIAVVFLSSHHPDEGGLYVWSKRAFGPFAGFITGWTYWASNLPYFPALLYFAAGNALFIGGTNGGALSGSPAYFIAVALAGLAVATIVNVYGLQIGKWLNNVGAISRWVVTLLLVALGGLAWWKFGPATPITAATMRPGLQIKDVIFWSVIAFAWTGPEAMPFMGGEIKRPRRTIPLGLAFAAPAIAVIYIVGTLSVLAGLTPNAVNPSSGVMQAIGSVAARLHLDALTPVAALLVALSCVGSCGAWLGAVARIPFVAGIDNYLPSGFGRMHPRWGSPVAALLTQAGIAAIFIFLGQSGTSVRGAYSVLVSSTVVITMVPFLFLFASALKLRASPATSETIVIPGGRWTVSIAATIGLVTTLTALVFAGFPADDDPNKALAVGKVIGLTVLMLASGAVIYLIGRRKALALGAAKNDSLAL